MQQRAQVEPSLLGVQIAGKRSVGRGSNRLVEELKRIVGKLCFRPMNRAEFIDPSAGSVRAENDQPV